MHGHLGQTRGVTVGSKVKKVNGEPVASPDLANKRLIDIELAKLLPPTRNKETTMQAFKRLCNEQAWTPFRAGDSDVPATETDKEEAALFDEIMATNKYSATATPGAANGFHSLERDWNNEVAKRFKKWVNGELESSELIHYKSTVQLQEH